LGTFPGTVYVLDDDKRLRGLNDSECNERVKTIGYDSLTDLITGDEKVVGMF
jgi:sulfur transfer complex TusBCD TusB component (DsrH family)